MLNNGRKKFVPQSNYCTLISSYFLSRNECRIKFTKRKLWFLTPCVPQISFFHMNAEFIVQSQKNTFHHWSGLRHDQHWRYNNPHPQKDHYDFLLLPIRFAATPRPPSWAVSAAWSSTWTTATTTSRRARPTPSPGPRPWGSATSSSWAPSQMSQLSSVREFIFQCCTFNSGKKWSWYFKRQNIM